MKTYNEMIEAGFHMAGSCKDTSKFSIDTATCLWWMKQSKQAIAALQPDCSIENMLKNFAEWATDLGSTSGNTTVYCRGQDFDIAILRHACSVYGIEWPFPFWGARDLRTLFDCREANKVQPRIKHHALHDAVADALMLYNTLNEWEKSGDIFVIDIETLGTLPTALPLSIGAVRL